VSYSKLNPRNFQYIPAVKFFVFLELEQKLTFFKGLTLPSGVHDRIKGGHGCFLTENAGFS